MFTLCFLFRFDSRQECYIRRLSYQRVEEGPYFGRVGENATRENPERHPYRRQFEHDNAPFTGGAPRRVRRRTNPARGTEPVATPALPVVDIMTRHAPWFNQGFDTSISRI